MKRLSSILLLFFYVGFMISCTKNSPAEIQDEIIESIPKNLTIEIVNGKPNLPIGEPVTEEQLYAMGRSYGCTLSKRAGTFLSICQDRVINGVTQIDPATGLAYRDCSNASAYDVYLNTVNNLSFPELYRDAVRYGFLECRGYGDEAGNSYNCDTENVLADAVYSNSILYVELRSRTICQASANPLIIQ